MVVDASADYPSCGRGTAATRFRGRPPRNNASTSQVPTTGHGPRDGSLYMNCVTPSFFTTLPGGGSCIGMVVDVDNGPASLDCSGLRGSGRGNAAGLRVTVAAPPRVPRGYSAGPRTALSRYRVPHGRSVSWEVSMRPSPRSTSPLRSRRDQNEFRPARRLFGYHAGRGQYACDHASVTFDGKGTHQLSIICEDCDDSDITAKNGPLTMTCANGFDGVNASVPRQRGSGPGVATSRGRRQRCKNHRRRSWRPQAPLVDSACGGNKISFTGGPNANIACYGWRSCMDTQFYMSSSALFNLVCEGDALPQDCVSHTCARAASRLDAASRRRLDIRSVERTIRDSERRANVPRRS